MKIIVDVPDGKYSVPSAGDCYIIKPDWDKIYLKEIRR